ncbi:MAG: hypothetical protein JNL67_18025 [Planctomycetaceae bacterium]|nr:hypothetical protein [Planctomycetaceae bacterium]
MHVPSSVLLTLLAFLPNSAIAQHQDARPQLDERLWLTVEGSEPWPDELFEVEKLPTPDEATSQVIESGKVEFKFYDDTLIQRKFTGETRMAIKYQLDVKFRWRVTRNDGKRQLLVTVDHRPTKFDLFHQILLPRDHAREDMFSIPLVLHELDHVKITLDPRYVSLFEEWYQNETKSLTLALEAGTKESEFNALINNEIQAKAQQCFARMLQLIHVRNRELDRLTKHGRLKLDDGFFDQDD